MKRLPLTFSSLALLTLSSLAAEETVEINRAMLGMFQPIIEVAENPANPITAEKVDLGRMLYYETRLSMDHTVSCNTCHDLASFGDDGANVSTGIAGQKGGRSAPTVYNAAIHVAQFWDGRAADVEAQAIGPVTNPIEMGMPDDQYVLDVLNSIPEYVERFKAAFPDEDAPLTYENVGKAIGAFERRLMTPSAFDAYLEGDEDALTNEEKKGLMTFTMTGCTTCHNGMGVGGHLYQKRGLVKAWETTDLGRFEHTQNEVDKGFFKVPSLRNITETGPYFHNGGTESLEEAVKLMAEYQLGRDLSDKDTQSIITFLKSLKGEIDEEFIKMPKLPESGPNTPGPVSVEVPEQ